MQDSPFQRIKQLTSGNVQSRSLSTINDIARELVKPLDVDAKTSEDVRRVLANAQIDWQDGRSRSLSPGKLLASVNKRLGLENAAEYLQLRRSDLRKVRIELWMDLPGLTDGITKDPTTGQAEVGNAPLSPFEAYTSIGLLVYQKLHNNKYTRTAEEESQAKPEPARTPGLHAVPYSPHREELRTKLESAFKRLPLGTNMADLLNEIMEESRQ